jgi:pyranose oxidase
MQWWFNQNEIEYQKDIDRFVAVIKGALSTVSVPKSTTFVNTLDPASWNSEKPFVTNGKNPRQVEAINLSAQAVTRGTGGMATHWTCAVPHFKPGVERPVIHPGDSAKDDAEWDS